MFYIREKSEPSVSRPLTSFLRATPEDAARPQLVLSWAEPTWTLLVEAATLEGGAFGRNTAGERRLVLPRARLRARFIRELSLIDGLSRDLGLGEREGRQILAVPEGLWVDDQVAQLQEKATEIAADWLDQEVRPYLSVRGAEALADQLSPRRLVDPIQVIRTEFGGDRHTEAAVLLRLAQRLDGALLFGPEMGPCSRVIDSVGWKENSAEFLTAPRLQTFENERALFSMVARIAVHRIPFESRLVLSTQVSKRIWMTQQGRKTLGTAERKGYFFEAGKPVQTFRISLPSTAAGVAKLDRDFDVLAHQSGMPAIPADAPDRFGELLLRYGLSAPEAQGAFQWAGVPFAAAQNEAFSIPRTVFEADEVACHENVVESISDEIDAQGDAAFNAQNVRVRSLDSRLQIEPRDLANEDSEAEEADEEKVVDRAKVLESQRIESEGLLRRVHAGAEASLVLVLQDRGLEAQMRRALELLYGTSLRVHVFDLPAGAHGSPPGTGAAEARLEAKVQLWRELATQIAALPGPRYVMVVAAQRYADISFAKYRGKEDPVNYVAGQRAICSLGMANVHYLLPPEGDSTKARRAFVMRLQSAADDLLFAHNGIVLNVGSYISEQFELNPPKGIYGIQVIGRSGERFSRKVATEFLAVTRIKVGSEVSDLRVGHGRPDGSVELGRWEQMRDGLRQICSGRVPLKLGKPGEQRNGILEKLIGAALSDIATEDPNAIVMIEWDRARLAPALRGLQDKTIGRKWALDGFEPATFPGLRLVRIRRDRDYTTSIRSEKRKIFREVDLENGTKGQVTLEDVYHTTEAKLLALSRVEMGACYLATPGYNISKMARGQSAYRKTQRFVPAFDESGRRLEFNLGEKRPPQVFQVKTYDPGGARNAAIPRGMEITVLSLAPEEHDVVAAAVMNLRRGYAHFSLWTGLPAPLFFEKKIRDHVAQYLLVDAEAERELGEASPAALPVSVTDLSEAVADATVGPDPEQTPPPVRVGTLTLPRRTGGKTQQRAQMELPIEPAGPTRRAAGNVPVELSRVAPVAAAARAMTGGLIAEPTEIVVDSRLVDVASSVTSATESEVAIEARPTSEENGSLSSTEARSLDALRLISDHRSLMALNLGKYREEIWGRDSSSYSRSEALENLFRQDARRRPMTVRDIRLLINTLIKFQFMSPSVERPKPGDFADWAIPLIRSPEGLSVLISFTPDKLRMPVYSSYFESIRSTMRSLQYGPDGRKLSRPPTVRDVVMKWSEAPDEHDSALRSVVWLALEGGVGSLLAELRHLLKHQAPECVLQEIELWHKRDELVRPLIVIPEAGGDENRVGPTSAVVREVLPAVADASSGGEETFQILLQEIGMTPDQLSPAARSLLDLLPRLAPGPEADSAIERAQMVLGGLTADQAAWKEGEAARLRAEAELEAAQAAAEQEAREAEHAAVMAAMEEAAQRQREFAVARLQNMVDSQDGAHHLIGTDPVTLELKGTTPVEVIEGLVDRGSELLRREQENQKEQQAAAAIANRAARAARRKELDAVDELLGHELATFSLEIRELFNFTEWKAPAALTTDERRDAAPENGLADAVDGGVPIIEVSDGGAATDSEDVGSRAAAGGAAEAMLPFARSPQSARQLNDYTSLKVEAYGKMRQSDAEVLDEGELAEPQPKLDDVDRIAQCFDGLFNDRYYELAYTLAMALRATPDRPEMIDPVTMALASHAGRETDGTARWTNADRPLHQDGFAAPLAGLFSESQADFSPEAIAVCAAALPGAIFDTGAIGVALMPGLTAALSKTPAVAQLLKRVKDMSTAGVQITPQVLRSVQENPVVAKTEAMRSLRYRAADRRRLGITSNYHHHGVNLVNERVFSGHHAIGAAIVAIASGAANARRLVEAARKLTATDNARADVVDRTQKEVGERHKLIGALRKSLIGNLEVADKFFLEWISVDEIPETQSIDTQLLSTATELRELLEAAKTAVEQHAGDDTHPRLQRALWRVLARVIDALLKAYLGSEINPGLLPAEVQRALIQCPLSPTNHVNYESGSQEYVEGSAAYLQPKDLALDVMSVAERVTGNEDTSADDALADLVTRRFSDHLDSADGMTPRLRSADLLARSHKSVIGDAQRAQLREAHAEAAASLRSYAIELRAKAQVALVASAITEADYKRIHTQLSNLAEATGIGDIDGTEMRWGDYPQAYAYINEIASSLLDRALRQMREEVIRRIEEARPVALEKGKAALDEIFVKAQTADIGHLVAAREQVRIVKEQGELPPAVSRNDELHEYVESFLPWITALSGDGDAVKAVRALLTMAEGGQVEVYGGRVLSGADIERAERILGSWTSTAAGRVSRALRTTELKNLAGLLDLTAGDFSLRDGQAQYASALSMELQSKSTKSLSPFNGLTFFVPPEYSSPQQDLAVVSLHGDRVGIHEIHGALEQMPAGLLLVRAKLTMQQRGEACGGHGLARALVIDDYLAIFIALGKDPRRLMLKVGLSNVALTLYEDSSPMKREMFFGRKEIVKTIRGQRGGAIMYGARRLGKSSILARVAYEEDWLNDDPKHRAVLINFYNFALEDEANYFNNAWNVIYQALAEKSILDEIPLDRRNADSIQEAISKKLTSGKLTRLLLLIDEAEVLMEIDSQHKNDQKLLKSLQSMHEKHVSQRSLGFVVAGLHNVKRLYDAVNSPCYHYRDPYVVRPFAKDDISEGLRLINEPMNAIGYEFDPSAPELPFQILAMASFFPVLTQIVCKNLKHLLEQSRRKQPAPFLIRKEHIQRLTEDDVLRREIGEKFTATLDLDPRFKVLALVLAHRQLAVTNEPKSGLTLARLADECKTYAPRYFADLPSHALDCLIDELRELSIIDIEEDRYVLTYPGIPAALGGLSKIEAALQDADKLDDKRKKARGELRHSTGDTISPLPSMLAYSLSKPGAAGVTILVGNQLTGIESIPRMRADQLGLRSGCSIQPLAAGTQISAERYRTTNLAARQKATTESRSNNSFLAVGPTQWSLKNLMTLAGLDKEMRAANAGLMLIASPQQAAEIAALVVQGQVPPEIRIANVEPWSPLALELHLEATGQFTDINSIVGPILAATGGMGELIQRALKDWPRDLTGSTAEDIRARLGLPSTMSESLKKMGIDPEYAELLMAIDRVEIGDEERVLEGVSKVSRIGSVKFLQWMGLIPTQSEDDKSGRKRSVHAVNVEFLGLD